MAVRVDASDRGKAQRFRDAALPHLDDVYTLARYLLSNPADAEDAAQECYLRAYRHFETFRGGAIKPWLLAILRNVCRAGTVSRGASAARDQRSQLPGDCRRRGRPGRHRDVAPRARSGAPARGLD